MMGNGAKRPIGLHPNRQKWPTLARIAKRPVAVAVAVDVVVAVVVVAAVVSGRGTWEDGSLSQDSW